MNRLWKDHTGAEVTLHDVTVSLRPVAQIKSGSEQGRQCVVLGWKRQALQEILWKVNRAYQHVYWSQRVGPGRGKGRERQSESARFSDWDQTRNCWHFWEDTIPVEKLLLWVRNSIVLHIQKMISSSTLYNSQTTAFPSGAWLKIYMGIPGWSDGRNF